MSTRREEERNEKIIRGLMKLPPNRRCINCNSLGPQYVCVNFWTFICMTCSGIHREFTHRVKSVSMSKFASQEVEALQNGGNQRAKEIFLKHWDQRERLPSSNNIEKIRDFIKQVYVDRKYAAGISSEKPPRDLQSQGRMDDETRRASSYHSYSQSPPYDFQYEDRRNRKQGVILSRKPGSDRGVYEGNVSGLYSPGRFSDHISAERFAMERSTSRVSDFSMSSDPFRSYPQSPNSQKEVGFSSPTFDSSKDRSIDDFQHHATKTQTERTVSSASFGSFDSSTSLSPATSGNLSNVFPQLDQSTTVHQNEKSTSDLQPSDSANSGSLDLSKEQQGKPLGSFNSSTSLSSANSGSLFDAFSHLDKSTTVHENEASTSNSQLSASVNSGSAALFKAQQGNHFVKSDPPIDLFQLAVTPSANHFQSTSAATSVSSQSALFSSLSLFDEAFQSSLGTTLETNLSESSSTNNGGWATFDLPEHTSAPKILSAAAVTKHSGKANPVENLCSFSTLAANTNMPEFQGSVSHGQPSTLSGLWDQNLQNAEAPPGASSNQVWKAFEDNAELLPSKAAKNLQVPLDMPSTTVHYTGAVDTENSITALQKDTDSLDGVSAPTISRHATSVSPFDQFVIPLTDEMQPNSEHKSLNPFDIPYDTVPNSSNGLLDMSSLGASLPSMQLPSSFIECIDESWFPPDTTTSFMPAAPQGGAPFITAQAPSPQLPNVQTHGPVASVGGNPFA